MFTIVIGNLDIPTYILHSRLMWCLGVMCWPITMVNSKVDIWYFVWCQIHHHPYNRIIWVGPISLILRTIRKVSPFNTVWLLPKYLIPYNKNHSIYKDYIFHWHHCSRGIFPYPFSQPYKFYPLIVYNRMINKLWVFTNSPKYPLSGS